MTQAPIAKAFVHEAEQLLMELLAIPGISCHELRVMEFLDAKLRQAGIGDSSIQFDQAHRHSPHGGDVGNLLCRLSGSRPGKRRLLLAHVDTVPICQATVPVRRGRWILSGNKRSGLGADDRTGAAAILAAALELVRQGLPHPPLTFLWTVQEEIGLAGARHVRLGLLGRPHMAFNFDGGAVDKITVGATGGYRMTIGVTGIAAHSGACPERGVNAITIAALAIAELQREGWLGRIEKQGRTGTSNIGVIHGGEATNVVAPLVVLRAEARSHERAFREEIVRAFQEAFGKAARSVGNAEGACGKVEFDGELDYEAFRLSDDDPSALAAESALRQLGSRPVRNISNGGLDANWLFARGIPTVSLGCGQVDGHTVSERVDRQEFHRACRLALRLALGDGP
ncbi:MAG: M20/M25/M40 family metallo-hydrolase [Thermoguttaceae bacterium]|jgi:tripeptide aminopeptidase